MGVVDLFSRAHVTKMLIIRRIYRIAVTSQILTATQVQQLNPKGLRKHMFQLLQCISCL